MAKGVHRDQIQNSLTNLSVRQGGLTSLVKGVFHGQSEPADNQGLDVDSGCNDHGGIMGRDHSESRSGRASPRGHARAPSPCSITRTSSAQDLQLAGGQSIKITLENGQSRTDSAAESEKPKLHPQESMNKFWTNFDPEYLGKVTQILPDTFVDSCSSKPKAAGEIGHRPVRSYQQARDICIRDVNRIVKECRSLNQKYTDSHFDIERDLKITRKRDCLDGLVMSDSTKARPSDVKRVCDIFEAPTFLAAGAKYDDIVQGILGDCWLLAALSVLACDDQLVRKICVVQDQDVGVYGFVFYRDGDWHQCIIDDKLYLRAPSYDESGDVVLGMYNVSQRNQEQSYTDMFQKGSKSLYFGQCRNENETWVPLLEKALAKAHGSYHSMVGGQTGEAIEDLTGGVTTEIYTTNILNKDEFWYNELRKIGKDFIFSAAAAAYREWRPSLNSAVREERRQGIVSSHAYAVLDTYEGHGQRLIKIRNPWGSTEWNGAWSDGSKEWNADWFQRLNHKFGDDGIFWISYEDMLKKYKYLDRTRIFGPDWHVAQQWTSVQVPWNTTDYQQTRFSIDVPDDTDAVIVLSQLDTRYFQGLEGIYNFTLQFRVQKDDEDEEEYLARSPHNYELVRSSNVEVKLEQGNYTVLFKVEARKTGRQDVETVIRNNIWRKEKLMQIGALYDLAHQKGMNHPITDDAETPGTSRAPSIVPEVTTTTPKEKDDPNRDSWNASCVVGLRVYSKLPDLGLKVVYAVQDDESKRPTLDRDDIAKAALAETQATNDATSAETNAPELEVASDEPASDLEPAGQMVRPQMIPCQNQSRVPIPSPS